MVGVVQRWHRTTNGVRGLRAVALSELGKVRPQPFIRAHTKSLGDAAQRLARLSLAQPERH